MMSQHNCRNCGVHQDAATVIWFTMADFEKALRIDQQCIQIFNISCNVSCTRYVGNEILDDVRERRKISCSTGDPWISSQYSFGFPSQESRDVVHGV